MPTTTRTPELHLARRHRAYIVKAMGETPHEIHDEVSHEGRTIDRVVLTADDVSVFEYKVALTDKLVEQCRLSCGVADFVWAVVGKQPVESGLCAALIDNLVPIGIGVAWFDGEKLKTCFEWQATRQLSAQPDLLRAAIASRHSGQGTAGAKHGQVTKEAAWLREVEREAALDCGLPLRHLNLRTGRFHKSNRLAVGALRNAIRDGQTTACIKDYPTETLVEVSQ